MEKMKSLLLYFLILVLIGEGVTLYLMNRKKPQENVLAVATTVPTVIPIPTLLPILSPTPTSTPIKTHLALPKPTAKAGTSVPQPVFTSQQINGFIDRFAAQYGVSPDVLRYIALCESGFNPAAQHAGYSGLFQFASATWKNLRAEMEEDTNTNLRSNAEEAAQTAAYAVSKGKRALWPNCNP